MIVKRMMRSILGGVRNWLNDSNPPLQGVDVSPQVPFDNSYKWLWATMINVMNDPVAAKRPHYAWGVLQGAALAKVLGFKRVSVLEIGVAGGAGLLAMERTAELFEDAVDMKIDVYGFDTGVGIPKPQDFRDMPFKWSEGYYPCDVKKLEQRLRRAKLKIGLLKDTMPEFVREIAGPVAFVGFDTGMYTGTKDAMSLFDGRHEVLIPRVACSFRSAIGKDVSDFAGERLAISEFNASHSMRKISKIFGLTYFVPPQFRWWWIDMMYVLHIFDHPQYGAEDAYKLSAVIDLDDNEEFHAVS